MLPVFVNPRAGSAPAVLRALAGVGSAVDVRQVEPSELATAVRGAVAAGATRLAVAGGDGTIATAAAVLVGSDVALAVIPGGTLNHFARDQGIPREISAAVALALDGPVRTADIATVNGRLFINTSSVGAYVTFVRVRERLERWSGYRVASFLAAVRIWPHVRRFHVSVDTPVEQIAAETPLVFVGVGERSLAPADLGARTADGSGALHVMLVHGRRAVRRWARTYDRAAAGRPHRSHQLRTAVVDTLLVDTCRVDLPRRRAQVAVDGEIVQLATPLIYRLRRDALRVVTAGLSPPTSAVPGS